MKKIIFILSLFITIKTDGQNTRVIADKIEAKSYLQIGASGVSGFSNDTTSESKSASKAITERAAKLYADKLGSPIDWYSIFKASGDNTGAIDVSSYIKEAIDNGQKVIYFPSGRFKIGTTIYPKDTISFIGNARGGTTLVIEDNIPAFKLSAATGGRMCQFRDITFIGTKLTGATTAQRAIVIDSTDQVYINNVSAFNIGGFAIEIANNGYCCATYAWNATRGNIISNIYISESYGGVLLGNKAEYNVVTSSSFVQNTYGIQNIGGNNRFEGVNSSNNLYGFYGTGGSNGAHGVAVGCTFNHNTVYNLYEDAVVNSFNFSSCVFMAGGPGRVYLKNSHNISFDGCMFVAKDTIIVENSTSVSFNNLRLWVPTGGDLLWKITGETPSVTRVRSGGLELFDPKNNSTFIISQSNGLVNMSGAAAIGINKTSPTYGLDVNGKVAVNKDSLPIRTGVPWGVVIDTATGQLVRQLLTSGSGTSGRLALWTGTNTLGDNTGLTYSSPTLTITGAASASVGLDIINTQNGSSAAGRLRFTNDVSSTYNVYANASSNSSNPNGMAFYSNTFDFVHFALAKAGSFFTIGPALNRNTSPVFRAFASGAVVINGATDSGDGQLQVNGIGRISGAGLYSLNLGIAGDYADNAAAVTAGLPVGSIYRTGDILKIVH